MRLELGEKPAALARERSVPPLPHHRQRAAAAEPPVEKARRPARAPGVHRVERAEPRQHPRILQLPDAPVPGARVHRRDAVRNVLDRRQHNLVEPVDVDDDVELTPERQYVRQGEELLGLLVAPEATQTTRTLRPGGATSGCRAGAATSHTPPAKEPPKMPMITVCSERCTIWLGSPMVTPVDLLAGSGT